MTHFSFLGTRFEDLKNLKNQNSSHMLHPQTDEAHDKNRTHADRSP